MATSVPDAPFVLPSVVFRPLRLAVACAVLAVMAIALAFMAGAMSFGFFFSFGLGLGLANALLVGWSVASITSEDHPLKGTMALNSAIRLLVITSIALVVAFVFRPYGFGVLFGLAVFQVVLVLSTVLPVYKKLRKGDWDDSVPQGATESTGRASSAGPVDAE
ncbi:MAG: ATP synthase subunit I [Actinomycetota bacterium]|nr:ATP synthase subunit I [Actinomycetota bacterium]